MFDVIRGHAFNALLYATIPYAVAVNAGVELVNWAWDAWWETVELLAGRR